MRALAALVSAIVLVALGFWSEAQEPLPGSFGAKLRAIDIEVRRQQTTAEKLEDQYLALLEGDLTPEQRGLVYVHIIDIGRYCRVPGDVREAYALEALSYPLAATDAVAMHVSWATVLRGRYAEWRGERFAVGRRRTLGVALTGLKLALDNGAPAERPVIPGVGRLIALAPTEADTRNHAAQMAARAKADELETLWEFRWAIIGTCAEIYSYPPFAPEELQARASEVLKDHPEVVQDIMDKLEQRLKTKRGEHEGPSDRLP